MFWPTLLQKGMLLKSPLLGPTEHHISMQLHKFSAALLGEEGAAWVMTEVPFAAGETGHFPTQGVTGLALGARFLVSSQVCKYS